MDEQKEVDLNNCVDAVIWAKEFMRCYKKFDYEIDEDTMRGWFANAIMAGMDEANRRKSPSTGLVALEENKVKDIIFKIDKEYGGEGAPIEPLAKAICYKFGVSAVTEEDILNIVIQHMEWSQEGIELTENGYLAVGGKWEDGRPNKLTKIRINQRQLAQSILTFLKEKGMAK